jgi:hypothetical protein
MRFLAISLADESRRFVRGFPPKGAKAFLNPDLEIAALMSRSGPDEITYQDERVEVLDLKVPFDVALLSTDFWQESRIREVVQDIRNRGAQAVLFGPIATSKHQELRAVADALVQGNILNAWSELRADARGGGLKPLYQASPAPVYAVPDLLRTRKPGFAEGFQSVRAALGCFCPSDVQTFCRQYLYHEGLRRFRDADELTGEVCDLRHKHVYLLDEDVAQHRDFYRDFFARVWHFRREWTVLAGAGIFDDARYVRLLAKAGVRVVMVNESWLSRERLLAAMQNRRLARLLRNQVRLLHRQRILVGARISLFAEPGREFDYEGSYRLLAGLSLDFLLVRTFARSAEGAASAQFVVYQPGLTADKPTWWKNQFYDLNAIARRSMRRFVRVGFYTTLRYYYPRSFAYRQNFLEGIAYPP